MTPPDPRIFFAAERTLLAWLRTGLTVIAIGFVVARFGLFLRLIAQQPQAPSVHGQTTSTAVLGVLFVAVGALAILGATVQHKRYLATLPSADLPPAYNRSFALVLSAVVGLLGLLLAGYLAVSPA